MSQEYNLPLLEAVCRRGVLCNVSVRYWRGCKKLRPEDLGLDPSHVSDRLIQLGHKRLVPKEALQRFALIESRAHSLVEAASFPFLGGIARFVPNPRLVDLTDKLDALRDEFREATLDFVAGYSGLRDEALDEWRDAARQMNLNGSAEQLLATIEQSFPPAGDITRRFAFETRLFQVAAPEGLRIDVAESIDQMEIADERSRIAQDASRRLQGDLDSFIRESVTTLRQETAKLAADVLATIDGSENGVHQRTLNRLTTFIDSFRSLNFAGDAQLEGTLERFRQQLLSRSAEDYRNDNGAMRSLTEGLSRLHDTAMAMVRNDGRDVLTRFGQMGSRRLEAVS
ncbi:DUF3150 domain-containing protein [Haloferula sp. A504]|uniref:DUF3150 domain-containing protein n=1 Tax=Haloferula sp. A504 TaxID=3373601 RepID=UPI0031C6CCB4|nr:DUF3150 domain-containing protein [Verrucomicrobiaceae bacterium E54]